MRSKKRNGGAVAGALPKSLDEPSLLRDEPNCFEGEVLSRFLESFRREIESAKALDDTLPHKFWIKKQFAVGLNEVTRVLERMPPHVQQATISSKEIFLRNGDHNKAPCVNLQAILIASDCNPRWLTKHLPALAASRNVPVIFVKDRKEGSLRLGELIKIKTAIAIGIKALGNSLNQLIDEVITRNEINNIEA